MPGSGEDADVPGAAVCDVGETSPVRSRAARSRSRCRSWTSSGWPAATRKVVGPLMSWPVRWTGPTSRSAISADQVLGGRRAVVVGAGGRGVAEAAEVDGEHAVVLGEQRDQLVEDPPGLGEPVDQHHGGAVDPADT